MNHYCRQDTCIRTILPSDFHSMPHAEMRSDKYTIVGWLPQKPDSMEYKEWFFNNVPVRYELYDMDKDPGQQHDIASERSEVIDSLGRLMNHLWVEMMDEGRVRF